MECLALLALFCKLFQGQILGIEFFEFPRRLSLAVCKMLFKHVHSIILSNYLSQLVFTLLLIVFDDILLFPELLPFLGEVYYDVASEEDKNL